MKDFLKYATGFFGIAIILSVTFAVLKFSGAISWRWIWVISPLWIQAIAAVIIVIAIIIIAKIVDGWFGRR